MNITSSEIRNHLKQFDSYFGHRPSRTKALLDPEYDIIPDAELMVWCRDAAQCVVDFFKQRDPEKYKFLTANTLYTIWEEIVSDCDDLTIWPISFLKMLWRLSGRKRSPAIFRAIINTKNGLHAVSWACTDIGWQFVEFQTLEIISNQRILAVT